MCFKKIIKGYHFMHTLIYSALKCYADKDFRIRLISLLYI